MRIKKLSFNQYKNVYKYNYYYLKLYIKVYISERFSINVENKICEILLTKYIKIN